MELMQVTLVNTPSISKELDVEESFVFEIETSLALEDKEDIQGIIKISSVRRDISILVTKPLK